MNPNRGGVQRVSDTLAKYLVNKGHKLFIYLIILMQMIIIHSLQQFIIYRIMFSFQIQI